MTYPPQHGFGDSAAPPFGQSPAHASWAPQGPSAPPWTNPSGQQPPHLGVAPHPAPQYPVPQQFVPQGMRQPYGVPMAMPLPYKDSTAAWLLGFFLGAFGAHHFYLGRKRWGWTYLGTVGLLALGWLTDLFLLPRYIRAANARPPVVEPARELVRS